MESKAIIHLIVDPNQLPSYEAKVCAAIDVYENNERTTNSYRLDYENLTPAERQLWDDFTAMLIAKEQ